MTRKQSRNQGGRRGEEVPLENLLPLGKIWWLYFETIGHSSKNLSPSQKTLRPSRCPKLVTGLLGHITVVCALSQKLLSLGLILLCGYFPRSHMQSWSKIAKLWKRWCCASRVFHVGWELSDDVLHMPIAYVLEILSFKIYVTNEWFWWLPIFFTPKLGKCIDFLKIFFTSEDKILETTSCQVFTTVKWVQW